MQEMLFRPPKKIERALSQDECREILKTAEYGILGVYGMELYPYTVPMNFVFDGRRIYMQTSNKGHLIDSINSNGHVSLCIVKEAKVVPQKFTCEYKSVMALGACDPVYMKNQKFYALESMILKYCPGLYKEGVQHIEKHWDDTTVLCMHVYHISGLSSDTPANFPPPPADK